MMELNSYMPTLEEIREEGTNEFDENLLLEYEILSAEELKKVECKCGANGEKHNDSTAFSSIHNSVRLKNAQVMGQSRDLRMSERNTGSGSRLTHLHPERPDLTGSISSSVTSTSLASTTLGYDINNENRVLDIRPDFRSMRNQQAYTYRNTCNNHDLNSTALHHVDENNSLVCNNNFGSYPRDNASGSVNMSIAGSSIRGSIFNLDHISTATDLSIEQHGIDFNSAIGRKLFIKAIRQKYMNIYYVLSQQLCGDFSGNQSIATFLVILNTLEIRQPELKGRFFQTRSIDDEMTFTDIASVARDNKISAEVSQVFKESLISNFRKSLQLSCKSSNILLLCCYHGNMARVQFSLIGGYFKNKDTILVLTASKSRFRARWIPVLLMWKLLLNGVTTEDGRLKEGSTGGYMLLQKNERNPRIAVRINKNALLCLEPPAVSSSQDFEHLLTQWSKWLAHPATHGTGDVILRAVNCVVNNLESQKSTPTVRRLANVRRIVNCKIDSLTDIISNTKVYNTVKQQIDSLSSDSLTKLETFSEWLISMTYSSTGTRNSKSPFKRARKKRMSKYTTSKIVYKDNLILAMCLIFWPYSVSQHGTNGASLAQSVHSDLKSFPWHTMVKVQEQLRLIVTVMQCSLRDRLV